jgi:hypothetical protein
MSLIGEMERPLFIYSIDNFETKGFRDDFLRGLRTDGI